MSQKISARQSASPQTTGLIIQPDHKFEVRKISQGIQVLTDIVDGRLDKIPTPSCDLWVDEDRDLKDAPINMMATFLWWILCPPMEERGTICGPCFVTGLEDVTTGYSGPVPTEVIELYERMEVARKDEGPNRG
ncbi:DUF3846 domain-containing protein [Mycobacterium intracellulare]|uniref:DUF3846 domain-containing protein n=1 Tax=Mycobacterium intracellulare TaxID=1767 RepID=UPI0012FD3132|nr:DUF3846 domain-containing protein [Mycobacterium intracellulare]MCA2249980.1 DUF3846 domain-containing protein [Mycobacterium intracellulare]MCA2357575.1 DUF3846 domain-containing protein [Mycobacterium intracellulare]MCA2366395.1 DUF3846 domain-containing protein [Mycobacterium intracellulare]UGT98457.1 DUF3846 domain-containing protein [Mycobacterium intracellulare]UQB99244.1 DUF3846 domain-containing protein [Mycobacterium intracellulare]